MGYRQYTSCVKPINFGPDLSFTHNSWQSYTGLTLFIGLIVAGVAASLNVYTAVITIGMLVLLITFLIWWLYGRLICHGGEECLIGAHIGGPTVQPQQKGGDDDASINVLLAPGPLVLADASVDAIPKETYWDGVQGYLLKERAPILQIGRDYVQDSEHVRNYMKKLHCEFEGSGIRNVLAWASAVLALLVAAVAALTLLPPPANFIVYVILVILAGLITLLAGLTAFDVGPFDPLNPGDPGDVNSNLGELQAGDLIFLKGDWVYDSLHTGWNELHAVHAGCKIGVARLEAIRDAQGHLVELVGPWPSDIGGGLGLDTPERVQEAVKAWCDEQKCAEDAEEGGNRNNPAHNWIIHPLIDGCQTVIIT
jgi:hypothetical protein